ncbi:MAG TPA: hypothetical protein VGE27_00705 [Gemmatimonas sp.]|uniref:hypothetical protein n=1 Tax=Gemmatimonas sp. TaxID=1962908 RepID=UPI002ED80216
MLHRTSRTVRALGVALLASAALAPREPLGAQGSLREQTRTTSGPDHIIAINPFLPLLGYFQGEYEQRIRPNVSFALAGSYVRFDDYYTNVDAKLRLYPQERALHGLGLSGGLGYGAIRRKDTLCDIISENCQRDNTTESAPTFSVEGQYQWLLGTSQSTAVTIGGGIKRYFIAEERSKGIQRVMPTMRLTIGYAF